MKFQTLDWDDELPSSIGNVDLVLAADCTYNPDSSPALVKTIARLAKPPSNTSVIIAMKVRHAAESIFFELMSETGLKSKETLKIPLSEDEKESEEFVDVYLFQCEI